MLPKPISKTIELPDGREITLESGKLAKQADGSVIVRMGQTMLLATVCANKEVKEGIDFMPLSVDYQEKFASAGRIPGGFLKREGRLSDLEILVCRLVDRVLRPMFPDDYHCETQVNIFLISAGKEILPDALATLAASSAIAVSDIPFKNPVSEVRVCRVDGNFLINPTPAEIEKADIELIVGGTIENIVMVEGASDEVQEADLLETLKAAHEAIKVQCKAQIELSEMAGKTKKREYVLETNDPELKEKLEAQLYDKVYKVAKSAINNKQERSVAFKAIKEEYIDGLPEDHEEDISLISKYFHEIEKKAARDAILKDGVRLDGRKTDEVRPIWSEINYLPAAHGSSIFTRGETQSLTSVTLGTKLDEKMTDSAMEKGFSKFMLHYNFPSFSVGEVRPNRGPGRREIGHGNLALRALQKVLPPNEDNPYTIRIVSDILESNGSSSMATVCAGSLALMDAGIKIKEAVSGIAMGLITDTATGKYAVLSDILGDEDHLGDMDFKVAGTSNGITACQMDIKVGGLSYEILEKALLQAKAGRLHILDEMNKTISETSKELKPHVPRYHTIRIDKELIGAVIGPGGKVVQGIQKETGATVTIDEVDSIGLINIFAVDVDALDKAVAMVKAIVTLPEVGEVYDGKVKSVMPYGAFVEILPGKDGLLHISEIKWERLESMDDVLQVGEELKVKLVDIDKRSGKLKLSRKVLLPRPETSEASRE
ncbi:MAG: polyribonucleotide nucleotidyltransferase [Cytophagales bacterium]|nr:polyribonucleotide nucleotidyltransferase [Cytophagales bacterium]